MKGRGAGGVMSNSYGWFGVSFPAWRRIPVGGSPATIIASSGEAFALEVRVENGTMARIFLASLYSNKSDDWPLGLMSEVYQDGTFELVPIPSRSTRHHPEDRTYAEIPSWHKPTRSLARLLKYDSRCARMIAHDDPDLHTGFGYGDIWSPKSAALFYSKPGDWLLIIANLAFALDFGEGVPDHERSGWHLVGCLRLSEVDWAGDGHSHRNSVSWHQHWRNDLRWRRNRRSGPCSVIVAGEPRRREQRFSVAVPLLTPGSVARLLRDKKRRPIDVLQRVRGRRKFATTVSCVGSYTRAIREIADTEDPADRVYLARLKRGIVGCNPQADRIIW
jgi:hypothetical protein